MYGTHYATSVGHACGASATATMRHILGHEIRDIVFTDNANDNANDNASDNANDNASDNANDNASDNASDNANDNANSNANNNANDNVNNNVNVYRDNENLKSAYKL